LWPTLSALDRWVNRKAGIRRNNFNADLNNKVREYQHLKKFKMQNEKLKIRYKRAELLITPQVKNIPITQHSLVLALKSLKNFKF